MSFTSEADLPCPPETLIDPPPDEEDTVIPPAWSHYPELLPENLVSPGPGHLGSAVLMSHVCQRWRQLALDHATLWAHTIGLLPKQVEIMVSRSKTSDLHVMLYGACDRPDPDLVLEYFRRNPQASSRIRTLIWVDARISHFRDNYCSPGASGLLTQCDLSGLVDLTVFARETFRFEDTPIDPEWGSTHFIHIDLPALKSASIHDTVFAFHNARNLTTLSLQMLDELDRDDPFGNLFFNLGQLLCCLNMYKDTLESLELSSVRYTVFRPFVYDVIAAAFESVDEAIIQFSRLSKLVVRDEFWQPEYLSSDDEGIEDQPYAEPIPLIYASASPLAIFFSFLSYPKTADVTLHVVCESEGSAETMHKVIPTLYGAGTPYCDASRVLFRPDLDEIWIAFYSLPEEIRLTYPEVDDIEVVDPWLDTVFGLFVPEHDTLTHNRRPSLSVMISYGDFPHPPDIVKTLLGDDVDLAALAVRSANEDDYSQLQQFIDSTANPGFTRWEPLAGAMGESTGDTVVAAGAGVDGGREERMERVSN
ncbi:unnamed protein product [Peniophora sp. CBMAI 1063]|nr:unnamed protein product [Peniophora sp. CBMAI 1063]